MGTPKKRRGRPKQYGATKPWHFARALIVLNAYGEARGRGEKHSVAVTSTVNFVRRRYRGIPISESAVKRVLAEFRPQGCPVELQVTRSILEGELAAEGRRRLLEMTAFAERKDPPQAVDGLNLARPLMSFKFGFGERRNYSRYNCAEPPRQ